MRKESNSGLLFLMAIGIVGLGLYYGATDNYSSGEIQVYHFICWAVLIVALLRMLQLVWEPVKFFWDQAWGRAHEIRKAEAEPVSDALEPPFYREQIKAEVIVPEKIVPERVVPEGLEHESAVPEMYSEGNIEKNKNKKKKN